MLWINGFAWEGRLVWLIADTPSAWDALSHLGTVTNVVTFVTGAVGIFVVWLSGSSAMRGAVATTTKATIDALKDGISAASARADEYRLRLDQETAMRAAFEVKNAELIQSSTADQAAFLLGTKAFRKEIEGLHAERDRLAARVAELEGRSG